MNKKAWTGRSASRLGKLSLALAIFCSVGFLGALTARADIEIESVFHVCIDASIPVTVYNDCYCAGVSAYYGPDDEEISLTWNSEEGYYEGSFTWDTEGDVVINAENGCDEDAEPVTVSVGGCPVETITPSSTSCGTDYGAEFSYTYDCPFPAGWWLKEGTPEWVQNSTCAVDPTFDYTSDPIQVGQGQSPSDEVMVHNGPPADVADCTAVWNITLY